MGSLRSVLALMSCVMIALAAGCGGKPTRVLVPHPGATSAARLTLGEGNIPPTVRITCPVPSALTVPQVPPALWILWEGSDPDGIFTGRPVEYKYILLDPSSEFPISLAVSNPDSLRRYYLGHPLGAWAGWDSTGEDTTRVLFTNLVPNQEYLFVLIGFDEAGAYSPLFSLNSNMLRFRVSFAGLLGPIITMSGPGLEYRYPAGSYCPCVSSEVPTDMPELRSATFQWFAEQPTACGNLSIRSYRWALDILDVSDQTPRLDEDTDLAHWSAPSLDATSATIGPFLVGEQHRLYIEAEDILGLKSLGIIRITVVPAVNQPPDCGGVTAEISGDWPPNHGFARVNLSGITDPDGDPVTITVTGVTQDEPLEGSGSGNTCPDAVIEDGVAHVRRERSGTGNGRVYTIGFTASDGLGGTCAGTADVCIPHHRARGCVKDDRVVNSLGPCGPALRRTGAISTMTP